MKLTHIRNIVAIAQRGSLRAAARHLGLAQPAMTRSMRELESELGANLFERNVTGVTLTPIGSVFVRRAQAIWQELIRAQDEVAQMTGRSTGRVAIGLSTAPHVAFLPRVLTPFLARYPDVRLEVIEGLFPTLESALRDGQIDFYVGPRAEDLVSREFVMETLCSNERIVLARKGHPLANARSLADLVGERWVTTSLTVDYDAELRPVFDAHDLPCPKIALQAHSALTMISAVAATDMLALMPQQWLGVLPHMPFVAQIAVKERMRAPSLRIIQRAALPLAPAAQHLSDLFRRAALNQQDYLGETASKHRQP